MGPGAQVAPGLRSSAQAGLVEATMARTSRAWAGSSMYRGLVRLRPSFPAEAMTTAPAWAAA